MRVIAHRGAPASPSQENTVEAVCAAYDAGADGVEVDLRLTADGVLALCHDPDVRRLTGRPGSVATTPWPVLREQAAQGSVQLCRVEWLLAAAAGRAVVLEVKPPPAGALERTALAVTGQLASLHRAGLPLSVTVSSFSPPLLASVRRLLRPSLRVRTALLGEPGTGVPALLRRAIESGHDEVHPHVSSALAAPQAVAVAPGLGVAVVPWTVNRRRDAQRLARLGVAGLITDVPGPVRSAVGAVLREEAVRA